MMIPAKAARSQNRLTMKKNSTPALQRRLEFSSFQLVAPKTIPTSDFSKVDADVGRNVPKGVLTAHKIKRFQQFERPIRHELG